MDGVTTLYVNAMYQVKANVVTKYYVAGGQVVAIRTGSTLSYLISDHIGSNSITVSDTGTKTAETRYKAWGEVRYQSGTNPSDRTYTGQRSYASDFGMMYYNARWYDSSIGHFAQADNIPLQVGDTQSLDRFAYVSNNPIIRTDPTGHDQKCDAIPAGSARDACNSSLKPKENNSSSSQENFYCTATVHYDCVNLDSQTIAEMKAKYVISTIKYWLASLGSNLQSIILYRVIGAADPQFIDFQNTGVLSPRGGPSTLPQHVNEGMTNSKYTSWTKSPGFAEELLDGYDNAQILRLDTADIPNTVHSSYEWSSYPWEAEMTIEGPISTGITIIDPPIIPPPSIALPVVDPPVFPIP